VSDKLTEIQARHDDDHRLGNWDNHEIRRTQAHQDRSYLLEALEKAEAKLNQVRPFVKELKDIADLYEGEAGMPRIEDIADELQAALKQ
jgi:hypothetical protein